MMEIEMKEREREMKEGRSKNIKHAIRIHKEGRVFVERCLVERENESKENQEVRRGRPLEKEKNDSRVMGGVRVVERQDPRNAEGMGRKEKEGVVPSMPVEKGRKEKDVVTPSIGTKEKAVIVTSIPVEMERPGNSEGNVKERRAIDKRRWIPYGKHCCWRPWWNKEQWCRGGDRYREGREGGK